MIRSPISYCINCPKNVPHIFTPDKITSLVNWFLYEVYNVKKSWVTLNSRL